MSTVKRILRSIRLDKIAAVDFPCQEHAEALIIKRAYPQEATAIRKALDASKLAKGFYDAVRKSGVAILGVSDDDEDAGAETFADALADQTLTQEFWTAYYAGTQALEGSLLSILKDDTVTDKSPPITESIKQFADYIEQIMPGQIGKSLAAGIAAIAGKAGQTPSIAKEAPVSDELKKALGLPATATEAEVLKAVADRDAIAKANENLAKMSDKHKGFMADDKASMPKGGKDAFIAMTADERDAHMTAHPIAKSLDDAAITKALADGDAFRTPEGIVIHKGLVGEAIYPVLKAQNATLVSQADELAKSRDREEESTFAKRAEAIGLTPESGSVLRKAYGRGGDVAAQAELETLIKGLTAQTEAGDLFKNFGHNNPVDGSATGEFMAKVAEVMKGNSALSEAQAYSRVYSNAANRDIVKRMKTEAA